MSCRKDECAHWKNCDSVSQQHCTKSWRNLVRLWRAQKLCDLTIYIQGEKFLCHSIVPVTTSPFFRDAFLKRNSMTAPEALMCEKEIIIDFMDKETFALVLNFMYTSEVDISEEKVRPMILSAAKLEMQGMVNSIMRRVLDWELRNSSEAKGDAADPLKRAMDKKGRSMHPNKTKPGSGIYGGDDAPLPGQSEAKQKQHNITVCGIVDELRLQGDIATLSFALKFTSRNFYRVAKTDGFLSASVHTIAALLDDDRLNVEEFLVFQGLCKWLEAERMHLVHAPYLLAKVRLQLLSAQELAEHVETKDYFMKNKKSRVLVLEAFRFHCLQKAATEDGGTGPPPCCQRPRSGLIQQDDDLDDWAVGEDGNLVTGDTSAFTPITPCSCCPNYIIASGGIDYVTKSACDGVYKFEERENGWTKFARLQHPRNHHAVVYAKGFLYVIGGSDPSLTGPGAEVCPVASCYKLGLESLRWTKIDSMTTPRMSHQAVYLNGFIYALGGQDHKQRVLRDTERLSTATGLWEYSGTLSSAKAGISVCVHQNRMWVAGGYCHMSGEVVDMVEMLDENYGMWQTQTPLRFARCFANMVECRGQMYILGGAWLDADVECGNFSSVYDIDIYNDKSKMWEGVSALRIGRHDAGAAVLGPRIYIVGGKHCNDGAIRNLDTIECFDAEKQDWVDGIASLPVPLLGPGVTNTT